MDETYPASSHRPAMSALPSPLKSPTCTSAQVTFAFQVAHKLLVNEEPVETATHHWPVSFQRPTRSVKPLPVKSPTFTSTQVTLGFQVTQRVVAKEEPVDGP